jgi:hypothetical protein
MKENARLGILGHQTRGIMDTGEDRQSNTAVFGREVNQDRFETVLERKH